MRKLKPLLAVVGCLGLLGAWQCGSVWQAGRPDAAIASAATLPTPELQTSLSAMRAGLTCLRQAAKTGDPAALREAERDVLGPLLEALAASRVDGAVDRARYMHVVAAVNEAQGLFKDLPYALEVQPGEGLPALRLPLRRSPLPAIRTRPTPLGWRVQLEGDGVVLRP